MNFAQSLEHIFTGNDLSDEQMTDVMRTVMTGDATPAQIGALLGALRTKGESVIEVSAAARVMRELATPVDLGGIPAIDIVVLRLPNTATDQCRVNRVLLTF